MRDHIPRRWLIGGGLILLATPCALVTLAGLLPDEATAEALAMIILPLLIIGQVAFLYWYYRRLMR
jgi:hypothetical protein